MLRQGAVMTWQLQSSCFTSLGMNLDIGLGCHITLYKTVAFLIDFSGVGLQFISTAGRFTEIT
jgi:hypothetical protein